MEFNAFPGEAIFLTFKLTNGSGWLTSHRLIICEHEPGHLEGQTPEFYFLKDFKNAQIEGDTLTAQFKGKQQAEIRLPINSPSLLKEIKEYIELASKNYKE